MNIIEKNLINGVLRNKENPDTFKIPTQKQKDSLKEGDYVYIGILIYTANIDAERTWVQIETIKDKYYVGKIVKDLTLIQSIKKDDLIYFESKNILKIVKKKQLV